MYEMYPNAWNEDERTVIPATERPEAPRRRPRAQHDVTPPVARRAREAGQADPNAA